MKEDNISKHMRATALDGVHEVQASAAHHVSPTISVISEISRVLMMMHTYRDWVPSTNTTTQYILQREPSEHETTQRYPTEHHLDNTKHRTKCEEVRLQSN